MNLGTIFFIFSILTISLLGHFFLYFSWIKIFSIVSFQHKHIVLFILLSLALSFILFTILTHIFPSSFTSFFYALSAIWYGIFVFLLFSALILWCFKFLALIFPAYISYKILYGIALFLLLGVSSIVIYGFINSFNMHVNRIQVRIKNLPNSWNGKTIAHISDLHIGTLKGEDFLNKVASLLKELKPDIVVITGDLFDGASGYHSKYHNELMQLNVGRQALYVSGNHEVYAGRSKANEAVRRAGIFVLDNDIINIEGLQFIGIAFPGARNKDVEDFDFRKHENYLPDKPKILLTHVPADYGTRLTKKNKHVNSYFNPQTKFSTYVDAGINLQLSGHTHAGQFFPFTCLTAKIFDGYHYGLHKIGNFHIYITSGTGTWGPPLRIGSFSEIALIKLIQDS